MKNFIFVVGIAVIDGIVAVVTVDQEISTKRLYERVLHFDAKTLVIKKTRTFCCLFEFLRLDINNKLLVLRTL